MTVVNGLPAHVLLVHFIVVLAPLTALLVMLCALWGAARRHLVWLTLVLAIVTTVLTPITIEARYQARRQNHSIAPFPSGSNHPFDQIVHLSAHFVGRQVDALTVAGQHPVETVVGQPPHRLRLASPRIPAIVA